MKHLLKLTGFTLIVLMYCSCSKNEVFYKTMTGLWHRTVLNSISIYEFRTSGSANVKTIILGSNVYENEYFYSVIGDKLEMLDYVDGTTRTYQLDFVNDSTVTLTGTIGKLTLIRFK